MSHRLVLTVPNDHFKWLEIVQKKKRIGEHTGGYQVSTGGRLFILYRIRYHANANANANS